MTDYTELLELLRYCSSQSGCIGCKLSEAYDCTADLTRDAAAAIEALQAQLPKRGEWKTDPHGIRWCSLCDSYYQDVGYGFNYCPNCGAKMEANNG